jgi:transcriptional regulator with XRE-family HTH domain
MYDAGVTRRRATERTIIGDARIAGGLRQSELADRAGTSQPTISAYERGTKSPRLDVAVRLLQACGWNLGLQPRVSFTEHSAPEGFRFPFTVPDRLWRLEAPACFRTIWFFDLIDEDNDKHWWDLSIRADRKLVYERLLTYGDEAHLMLYLDGALLVDLWDELRVPDPMWGLWEPIIEANRRAPAQRDRDYYFPNEQTPRSPAQVIRHADGR